MVLGTSVLDCVYTRVLCWVQCGQYRKVFPTFGCGISLVPMPPLGRQTCHPVMVSLRGYIPPAGKVSNTSKKLAQQVIPVVTI